MLTTPGPSLSRRRAIAIVAAALMIGGAVAIRSTVFEGDDGNGGGDGRNGGGSRPARLACVTELEEACRDIADRSGGEIEVTIETAGETADRLTAAQTANDAGIDGWLTLSPWPAIVEDARARANATSLLGSPSVPIARSPIVLAVRADRAAALAPRCPERTLGWTCLGDAAGKAWTDVGGEETWGTVKLAHEDATGSASGALVVGQAVGHFLATPDVPVTGISRIDWESSDAFASWFQRLERAVPRNGYDPPAGSPFAQFLQGRFVEYDAVAALEAEVAPALARASGLGDSVTVVYPDPVGTADVVFAPIADEDAEDLVDRVTGADARRALAAAGWRVDGEDPAPGVPHAPAMPDGNGLPSAGAIDALRSVWEEVAR